MFSIAILVHEHRSRRRLVIVEWIGLHPSCERGSIFIAKASLEKLGGLCFAIEPGNKPAIKAIVVVYPLLACQCGKPLSGDSKLVCLRVVFCASSSPFCRLIPAPRGSNGDQGKDQRFDNFNRFKTSLRYIAAVTHQV